MEDFEIYCGNTASRLSLFSTDIGHIFGCNVGIKFLVLLRRKGPKKPENVYDTARIHSLKLYTCLVEYKTKLLGLQRPFCSSTLPCFRYEKLGPEQLLHFTWAIRLEIAYDSNCCSKNLLKVYKLS